MPHERPPIRRFFIAAIGTLALALFLYLFVAMMGIIHWWHAPLLAIGYAFAMIALIVKYRCG